MASRSVLTGISQLNVCPGSTPTLVTTRSSLNKEGENDGDEKDESSESEATVSSNTGEILLNWNSDLPESDLYLPGNWGTQCLEDYPWNDKNKPCVVFQKYENLDLNEIERTGVLTDRIIATSSSYLDKSPETEEFVLCKINLSKKHLTNIDIMAFHHYLQYVDLSHNQLTKVNALGELPFLMYLDVSHNLLDCIVDFKAPFYLTYVNYSYNLVSKLRDLNSFWSIVFLDVSHNNIAKIEGLETLKYLRHLNLSYNAIKRLENLNHMRLLTLNVQNNFVSDYEKGDSVGLKTLEDILKINLDHNQLKSLKLFKGMSTVQRISVQSNQISDLMQMSYLRNLNFLSEVDFRGNPVTTMDRYMEVCVYNVKFISVLDGEVMDAARKVAAKSCFEPSPQVEAFRGVSTSLFLQQLNDPVLGLPIVPFDQPQVPIIILVGPPGSGKYNVLKKFCNLYKKNTIMGMSYTTRPKSCEPEAGPYYYKTTEEFWEMAANGEFLTISEILGYSFGFAERELEKTIGQQCALMLYMDLKGALTLRAKNMKSHLVLAMPRTEEVHANNLWERYYVEHDRIFHKGATPGENSPSKAKEFLQKYNEIIEEIASDRAKGTSEDASSENDCVSEQGSIKSGKDLVSDLRSSTGTIGILKTSYNRVHQPRSIVRNSVAFQNNDQACVRRRYHSQQSRSVTFNQFSADVIEKSVSGTVVDKNQILSVLSRSRSALPAADVPSGSLKVKSEALQSVVKDVLKLRDAYISFHESNPGVFSEVIFTDEEEGALKKLAALVKQSIENQSKAPPLYEFKKDAAYQAMVATRLKVLHDEIESEMSISQKQLNEYRHHTPKGKPFESHLKQTKEDIMKAMSTRHHQALHFKLPNEVKLNRRKSSVRASFDSQQ